MHPCFVGTNYSEDASFHLHVRLGKKAFLIQDVAPFPRKPASTSEAVAYITTQITFTHTCTLYHYGHTKAPPHLSLSFTPPCFLTCTFPISLHRSAGVGGAARGSTAMFVYRRTEPNVQTGAAQTGLTRTRRPRPQLPVFVPFFPRFLSLKLLL